MSFKAYIEINKERFLNELFELIKIPSVSAVTEHNNDTRNAAKFLFDQFQSLGMDNCETCRTHQPQQYVAYQQRMNPHQ